MTRLSKTIFAAFLFASPAFAVTASFPTQTTATQNYFVDTTNGADTTLCTATGTGACKTIQAALNKMPKGLRHVVTLTITAGTYAGFAVEGFYTLPSFSGATAGLIIQGTRVATSPTTGTASGTASACNGGGTPDPNTHSTLTDGTQTWTAHDTKLRGKTLCLTSGAGNNECLQIEDNSATVLTVAGYWSDFHGGWSNCSNGDGYAIWDNATHINTNVSLPAGVQGLAGGQASTSSIAAIVVSNVHGGATGSANAQQVADNFQFLIKDLDIKDPAIAATFVDGSDHVGFKHITSGILDGKGLSSGAAYFSFRNSTQWTVQSSAVNCTGHTSTMTGTMIASSITGPDTQIGLFGNVEDNCQAYFGDSNLNQTGSYTSVTFDGESIKNLVADTPSGHYAAIQIQSGTRVHVVGTKIAGVTSGHCMILGDANWGGSGTAYFEGGDFGGCIIGISARGNWDVHFINVPFISSQGGANVRFGLECANGAKCDGLSQAYNGGVTSLTGGNGDTTFDNGPTGMAYTAIAAAPGNTISDPRSGGMVTTAGAEATTATRAVPSNWVDFTQGERWAVNAQSGGSYVLNLYDRTVAMSQDSARTVTLPTPVGHLGAHYLVCDTSLSVTAGHTVTITPAAGAVWYAGATHANVVLTPGTTSCATFLSDGANYQMLSRQ